MKVEKICRNLVKGKALKGNKRVHFGSVAVAQVPPAQGIISVWKMGTRDVAYHQSDVPGSTGDPNFHGTGLDKDIATPAYLKYGHCCSIVWKQVDQFVV